jgi:hypothetical protein
MKKLFFAIRARRGTILATTMVLVALAAFGALMLSRTELDQKRLNGRRRDLARALYAAEAGISLVQHWSNFPADYTPSPFLFLRGCSSPEFPLLRAILSGGGRIRIAQSTLAALREAQFRSDYGYTVANLDSLEILPPEAGDPVACFLKIRATGKALSGITKQVTGYMTITPHIKVQLPGALLSEKVASTNGNARIHWGQSWSQNTFEMLNKSQMDYLIPWSINYDPWAKYRTESNIGFNSTWSLGTGADLYDLSRRFPGALPASGVYANAFEQHIPAGTLQWPNFDYLEFKQMAMSHGRYYSTDAAGVIYKNGDPARPVDFLTEFGVNNRDTYPYDLVFIDTINRQPPSANGSNLATIKASGNGLGLKGIFWIGANFDGSGIGNPPFVLDAQDPNGNPPPGGKLQQIFLEGVLYAAGTVAMAGNCGVYGSVVAKQGFTGGGTPDIWYNNKLASGLEVNNGNVGSNLTLALEKNYN